MNHSIPDNVFTDVPLDAAEFDTGNLYAAGSDFMTVPASSPGIYVISGNVTWTNNSGFRTLTIAVSGLGSVAQVGEAGGGGGAQWSQSVTTVVRITTAQTVRLLVEQQSGTTAFILAGSHLALVRVGP